MNEFWIVAVLPSEQGTPSPRVTLPADTLPDKPIPMEHEHGEKENSPCGT